MINEKLQQSYQEHMARINGKIARFQEKGRKTENLERSLQASRLAWERFQDDADMHDAPALYSQEWPQFLDQRLVSRYRLI